MGRKSTRAPAQLSPYLIIITPGSPQQHTVIYFQTEENWNRLLNKKLNSELNTFNYWCVVSLPVCMFMYVYECVNSVIVSNCIIWTPKDPFARVCGCFILHVSAVCVFVSWACVWCNILILNLVICNTSKIGMCWKPVWKQSEWPGCDFRHFIPLQIYIATFNQKLYFVRAHEW